MSARRPRVLFVGEAVTLAHVVRPLQLARTLDPAQYDIHVAWDGRYDALLGDIPFQRWPLCSIPSRVFTDKITGSRPVYDEATLSAYVRDDLALLDRVRPDLVVGDLRLSLGISARLAGVPYAMIANIHWSSFAEITYPAPLHPISRVIGLGASAMLMNRLRTLISATHVTPVNRLRRRHGLAGLSTTTFSHYSDADHVLYADAPGLIPTASLPDHHQFLGPVVWSPSAPLPTWWEALPVDRPVVYVNLGSSGKRSLLPAVLRSLAELPVSVVAATVGAALEVNAPNVFLAPYLPGDAACARASLVVCNGGSGALHQALLAGVPAIGVTGNLDQQLNMQAPVRHGAAVEIRGDRFSVGRLRDLARQILGDDLHAARARVLRSTLEHHRADERFPAILADIVGRELAA